MKRESKKRKYHEISDDASTSAITSEDEENKKIFDKSFSKIRILNDQTIKNKEI